MPRCSLRGRSPSLRAGGLSEPEAGAEPGPAAAARLDFRKIPGSTPEGGVYPV